MTIDPTLAGFNKDLTTIGQTGSGKSYIGCSTRETFPPLADFVGNSFVYNWLKDLTKKRKMEENTTNVCGHYILVTDLHACPHNLKKAGYMGYL